MEKIWGSCSNFYSSPRDLPRIGPSACAYEFPIWFFSFFFFVCVGRGGERIALFAVKGKFFC